MGFKTKRSSPGGVQLNQCLASIMTTASTVGAATPNTLDRLIHRSVEAMKGSR